MTPKVLWFYLCAEYWPRRATTISFRDFSAKILSLNKSLDLPYENRIIPSIANWSNQDSESIDNGEEIRRNPDVDFFEQKVQECFSLQDYEKFYKEYPKVDKDTGVKQGRVYEKMARKYNIWHDVFQTKLKNFICREYKRMRQVSKITKKQKSALGSLSLDSIIKLSKIRHREVSEDIKKSVVKAKDCFQKCQIEESYFLKAVDLDEPTCDIHCVFESEKIFLNLVEMEKCRNRTKSSSRMTKENTKSSFQSSLRGLTSKPRRGNSNNFKILDGDEIPNELYVCQICNGGDYQDDNMIVFCSRCSVTVHQKCYGVKILPETEWICDLCLNYKEQGKYMKCLFCPRRGGAMKPTIYDYNNPLVCQLNPSFIRQKSSSLKRKKTRVKNRVRKKRDNVYKNKKTNDVNSNSNTCEEMDLRKFTKKRNEEFEKNLYYNYFRQPDEYSEKELLYEPRPRKCWAHLSCVYWNPETVYYYQEKDNRSRSRSKKRNRRRMSSKGQDKLSNAKLVIEGLDRINPLRFKYKCGICKKAEGAVIQCVAKNCLKSYHAECARRDNVMLSYKHITPPYWRLYCDQHSELLLKKNVLQLNSKFTSEIVKFCKAVDKLYETHGVKKAQNRRIRDGKRKMSRRKLRELEMKKRFLESYYRNSNVGCFKFKLRRLKRNKYELVNITIPKKSEYEAHRKIYPEEGDFKRNTQEARNRGNNDTIEEILGSSSSVEELEVDKSSNFSDDLRNEATITKVQMLVKRKPVKKAANKRKRKKIKSPGSAKKSPVYSRKSISKKVRSKSQEKWRDADKHPAGKNSSFFQSLIRKQKRP